MADRPINPVLAAAFARLHGDRLERASAPLIAFGSWNMSLRYMSLAILLFAVGVNAPAHGNTFFVASYGNDGNLCTKLSPCASIFTAVSKASANDTVICLDTTTSAAISIDKAIDIDCAGARHVLRDGSFGPSGAAILINIPTGSPFRTVRLRGISILGSSSVFPGIDIVSAATVSLEDIVVSDAIQQGIIDRRTGGQTKLFITDSIIRNSGGVGICACSQGPTTVVLDNVRSENNLFGMAVATGNSVVVNRSVMSGNTNAGVEADGGSQVVVNNSTISHNNIGVQSAQSVRLSNNDIAFNATAVSGSSGTFGNNRFSGNGTIGTPPAALGGASSDLGQQ
jgi:hypothetical protein